MDSEMTFEQYRHEAGIVINGLIGAMPPSMQKRWPHLIARARRLTSVPADAAALSVTNVTRENELIAVTGGTAEHHR